ncbi:tetratricopeptide repeat protein [Nostoc sp. CHAB 5834]|nr:tetratricopeptide repeat protein [Nostoc sp. CHAB 5834]
MSSSYTIPIQHFDTNLLPPNSRKIGSPEFRAAVSAFFGRQYLSKGHYVSVEFSDTDIRVTAVSAEESPISTLLPVLNSPHFRDAIPPLENLLRESPSDMHVLYNLGSAYNKDGAFQKGKDMLQEGVRLYPDHSNMWAALGFSQVNLGAVAAAKESFEKATSIDPENGYAWRNLGVAQAMQKEKTAAVQSLRKAVKYLPDDPLAILGLAQALEAEKSAPSAAEAAALYQRLVDEQGSSDIAERAREALTQMAHKTMRAKAHGSLRMDVVFYILGALEKFDAMGEEKTKEVAVEIAFLGREGLDLNDPEPRYTLRSVQGEFSGLHLVAMMYTAFQQIDPGLPPVIDLSEEYSAALGMSSMRQKKR